MRTYEKNQIQSWSKINHAYLCAVYFKAKDIVNFIRHYFYLRMNFAGEYSPQQGSLRAEISALTGWAPTAITNAIVKLKSSGELEQEKNLYRPNPRVSNRFGAYYKNRYNAKELSFDDPRQQAMFDELEKIIHTRLLPSNQKEADELQAAEEEEAENMLALAKIERLEETVREQNDILKVQSDTLKNQNDALKNMEDLLRELLTKVSPDIQAEATQKLATVIPFRMGK